MTHQITILGERTKCGIDNCFYDVEVEVSEEVCCFEGDYWQPKEYEGGEITSITYKGIEVIRYVLNCVSSDDILNAIERKTFEVQTEKMKRYYAQ
jgi:hypothetical protein